MVGDSSWCSQPWLAFALRAYELVEQHMPGLVDSDRSPWLGSCVATDVDDSYSMLHRCQHSKV